MELGFKVEAGTTAADLEKDTSFVGTLQTGFAASLSTDGLTITKDMVTIDKIEFVGGRRRASAESVTRSRNLAEAKTLKIAYIYRRLL